MLDLSIQSRAARPDSHDVLAEDASETLRTVIIPVVPAFSVSAQTTYTRRSAPDSGPADLTTFEPDYWNDAIGGKALISTSLECVDCVGACPVLVDSIHLVPGVCASVPITSLLVVEGTQLRAIHTRRSKVAR